MSKKTTATPPTETQKKESPYQALLRRREELRLQQEKAKNK